MITILIASVVGVSFTGSSLLALFGRALTARGRSYAVAVAAAVLLVVAFGDLFPEGLELAGRPAVIGFIGAFGALFLIESLTRAHIHHAPEEHVHRHAYQPFLWGLAFHNATDGFALGVSASLSPGAALVVGLGVLIHQLPVGLSVAAVLAAGHTPRRVIVRSAIVLGLAIPVAAALVVALPPLSAATRGMLVSIAGGVLTYLSTTHLLPEAHTEHPSRTTGFVFAVSLALMTLGLFTILAE